MMAIVLAIFWYALKRPTPHVPISGEAPSASSKPQSPAAATADVAPAAAPVGNAAGAMGAPETVRPAARPKPANTPAAETGPQSADRSVWHVVVYTYTHESAAQRAAAELAAKYPQLEPQVFSPTGSAPFLVVLGGGMNRQEAFTRREAALAAGLPKDTYAQNYRR
jgi:hypothetical protein